MATSRITTAALASKRTRGERTGSVPLGARLAADGVHLEADPVEMAAVAMIHKLRAQGLTLRAIGATLDAQGVPARGKRWHPETVASVLRRGAE